MRKTRAHILPIFFLTFTFGALPVVAQQGPPEITQQDLLEGLKNTSHWLGYSGGYSSQRHSPLTQITPENVRRLAAQWSFQTQTLGKFEATPLFVDGVLYVTGPNDTAWAIDAHTGKTIWHYDRELPPGVIACCGMVNRGFAVLGDKLFKATLDSHLLALSMKTGAILWNTTVQDFSKGYSGTMAPLVVKDKVIIGTAGGEYGIRGFIDAYDVQTGRRAWRFYTTAGPGDPENKTWKGDSWQTGGGATWLTGSYDPELNLVYWGTGNPGPDYNGDIREGDNLYTSSIVALDADTGKLKWYYQFSPHDTHDWDACQIPILADLTIGGQLRRVVMVANRNGFFYTLDRVTGKVILAKPFIHTEWAKEIGPDGRPVVLPNSDASLQGATTCPDNQGGTNWGSPAYSPGLRLMFVTARITCGTYYSWNLEYKPGESYRGGAPNANSGYSALRAYDPTTIEQRWEFRLHEPAWAGVLSTAGNVVFSGDMEGNFLAVDARNGKSLWRYQTGMPIYAAAITYLLDGRQYVVIPSGTTLTAFALPDPAQP
jgi:alcohol dehydrogenase (cytochrome c)